MITGAPAFRRTTVLALVDAGGTLNCYVASYRTPLQGTSRYEVMLQPMKPLRYSHLRSCGHTAFTGPPLTAALEMVGSPGVDLWVASSDSDADVFAYLEDVDPASGKAR